MAEKKKPRSYGRSKSGVELTDELLERMAAQAEAGFDVDKLIRRRRGRPAMGSAPADTVPVRLDPELRHLLGELGAAEPDQIAARRICSCFQGHGTHIGPRASRPQCGGMRAAWPTSVPRDALAVAGERESEVGETIVAEHPREIGVRLREILRPITLSGIVLDAPGVRILEGREVAGLCSFEDGQQGRRLRRSRVLRRRGERDEQRRQDSAIY